jgi:hypothetical protein
MAALSPQTLMMAVQGVDAEIHRIIDAVNGDVDELEPDGQELLMAYSQAAAELKEAYAEAHRSTPNMPSYDELISPN